MIIDGSAPLADAEKVLTGASNLSSADQKMEDDKDKSLEQRRNEEAQKLKDAVKNARSSVQDEKGNIALKPPEPIGRDQMKIVGQGFEGYGNEWSAKKDPFQGLDVRSSSPQQQPAPTSASPDNYPNKLIALKIDDTEYIRIVHATADNGFGTITPTGMNIGDDPPYKLTPGDSGIVQLGVDLDDSDAGQWAAISADYSLVSGLDANTSNRVYFQIGTYAHDGDGNLIVSNDIRGSVIFLCVGQLDTDVPVIIRAQLP